MFINTLIQAVHGFLDAEIMLEQRRSESGDVRVEQEALDHALRTLCSALVAAGKDADKRPLVTEAEAYLSAVTAFELARQARTVDLAGPARQLEIAQRDLQEMLGRYAREGGDGGVPAPPSRKRLLVAVDGSRQADWATDVAVRLARDLDASVRLVYVEPVHPMDYGELCYVFDHLQETRLQAAEAILRVAQSRFGDGTDVTSIQRGGDTATEIVNTARRWGADFIIMGTRGRGRLARFTLGSTAESVIRLATCPVITVSHAPPLRSARAEEQVVEVMGAR